MGKKLLAHEYFQAPPFDVLLRPAEFTGRWDAPFGRQAPLHVEIGMGLGHHLVGFAETRPDYNHVGLEMKMHRIYTARHMALRRGVRHVRYVQGDANASLEAFGPGEVSLITLLFSDPWPLDRHADRRLTCPAMVARFQRLLAKDGHLHFRTDDPGLYHYSVKTFEAAGFTLQQEVRLDRIITDFEKRWLNMGRQIYGFDAYPPA